MEIVNGRPVLRLSPVEAAYVASLLGYDELFGFGDPFFAWLVEEIKDAFGDARRALVEKGVIYEDGEGNLRLDQIVAETVRAHCEPELIHLLYHGIKGGEEGLRVCCRKAGLYAVHDMVKAKEDCVTVKLGEHLDDLSEDLLEGLPFGDADHVVDERVIDGISDIWSRIVRGVEKGEGKESPGYDAVLKLQGEVNELLEGARVYVLLTNLWLLDGRWNSSTVLYLSDGESDWTALVSSGKGSSHRGKSINESIRDFVAASCAA